MLPSIEERIARELGAHIAQIAAAVRLLDEGATVPFIARYRKEATGGLDDTQLRTLEERLTYLRELEERRAAVLASIAEQGKLTDVLQAEIEAADTKQRLEDLYLPYKPKRRTKAQIAREAGLEPLALALLADPGLTPEAEAAGYVDADKGIADVKAALDGARQILMERFAEDAELVGKLRRHLQDYGMLVSTLQDGKEAEGQKFRDWFAYSEAIREVPSHRALAMFRGRNEGILRLELKLPEDLQETAAAGKAANACEGMVASHWGIRDGGRPGDRWLLDTVRWTWRVKLSLAMELELFNALFERAEDEAIRVFGANLKDLLLAAPAGPKAVIGLDPGIRTGVKVAVVDRTGKLLDTATVYPHEPRNDWEGALRTLAILADRHKAELIAIGNGTASRETDKLAAELIRRFPEAGLSKVVVSEAGASVYSASEFAAREFPELDVSLRGAVSIARRLQDPLAELVKIEPKAIGVGQYQHDVSQSKLAHGLDAMVEDCVNAVGVDLNTASAPLLARVSGLNTSLAANIVSWRDQHGAFPDRETLKEVPRLGAKTFEQAAGFLRIQGGDNPLDASSVHPEAYPVVERILTETGLPVKGVIGNTDVLRRLDAKKFTDERFGLPTVQDILRELEKPGRDPRPEFRTAHFKDGVEDLKDLQPGMMLEGTVTNVTNFGAFVDIGVHQDGLVHVSALSNKFVKDPREVVKAGDIVRVKVLEVDIARKRIALTMRMSDEARPQTAGAAARPSRNARAAQPAKPAGGAMAEALARALRR
ncbi:RNA-binding transcriptional accessory protein [Parasulfuritortus cantonensis]|uniref:RNA-binding transcriptional accessory protein n=1 Tax=Parasulfuritortus cantonensis TaxID=2528202 RepID=A0A4R1BDX5_9PROT|nr:Tex family protein [Parasulfuritortus cantonensis]TCJ15336.1 RNA-binding transcriptional accessory protein [Parasulfuritortus cantonensis]